MKNSKKNIKEIISKNIRYMPTLHIDMDRGLINKPKIICKIFITPKSFITPHVDANDGFKLDDIEFYENFLAEWYEKKQPNDTGLIATFIQESLNSYFMKKGELPNIKGINSIKEYKGKGGVCIHYSALAHNLFRLLGVSSYLIITDAEKDNHIEKHAFLLLKDKQHKHYIFDPTNESKVQLENGQIFRAPTLVKKSLNEIGDFIYSKADIQITEKDEQEKQARQTQNIKITLPKITYKCKKYTKVYNDNMENGLVR